MLIVTARMDSEAQAAFDMLRETHYPPEWNYLKAHITLFHALPCEQYSRIVEALEETARVTPPLEARTVRIRFLGRGVAFDVECPPLVSLRSELQRIAFAGMELTRQDSQVGFRPHITVQNKVEPDAARRLFEALSASFVPAAIAIPGLSLWEYQGGPWRHLQDFTLKPSALPGTL